MLQADTLSLLAQRLDEHYVWPALYTFKFIVPKEQGELLRNHFSSHDIAVKHSKHDKYSAFTIRMMMPSTHSVLDVYASVSDIRGLIAL